MDENLEHAGQWLFRKMQQCYQHSNKAGADLTACNIDIETLREQWHLQIEAQTQPLPSKRPPVVVLN